MHLNNRTPEKLREFLTRESPTDVNQCLEAFDIIANTLFESFLVDSTYQELLNTHQVKIENGEFNESEIKRLREALNKESSDPHLEMSYHSKLALTYRIIAEDLYDAQLHEQVIIELSNANFHLGAVAAALEIAIGQRIVISKKNTAAASSKNDLFKASAEHFANLIITQMPQEGWKTKLEAASKLNNAMVEFERLKLGRKNVPNEITERLTDWMRDRDCVKAAINETLRKNLIREKARACSRFTLAAK